jgi:cellulose synthase/poly-beta-1,6-N-acetylglucosamine synthase-like glycosyltransferase
MSHTPVESGRAAQPARRQESHRSHPAARTYPRLARDSGIRQGAETESSLVLAMLSARGIAPSQIAAAAAGARAQGVTAGDFLIGNGYVAADTLYGCIADHLGMPFLGGTVPLREDADPNAAARLGIAPIAPDRAGGARIVVAPRGAALEQFLGAALPARKRRLRFAVTSPDRFENAMRVHAAGKIAAAASQALSDHDPNLSAKSKPTGEEIAVAGICVAALIAVSVALPAVAGACLALTFFAAILLRLFAIASSFAPPVPGAPVADADLPIYTIIVALYREEAVIAQLLAALQRLDYPRAKLDIKIVVEADDLPTISALRAARGRYPFDIVIAPPGVPRTKPRALNVALPFARGALTCVFDAEDQPDISQLRRAAEVFAQSPPDLACLQARLVVDNYADNWLTKLYAIDYATLFEVIDPGLAKMSLPIPLGGTSNHFRTAALRAVGGWDAWNVTEDADLGLRLARFGYKVATFDSQTLEEVPAAVPAFLRQRTRWIKGWLQTLFINARNPRRLIHELGFVPAACTMVGLGSAIIGALFWPIFAIWLGRDALFGPLLAPQTASDILHSTLWCFNAGFGAFAVFGAIAIAMKRQKLGALWPWLFLWPLYQALVTIAAWYAVAELWRNPYGWAKTEHGLAKSSRRQPAAS